MAKTLTFKHTYTRSNEINSGFAEVDILSTYEVIIDGEYLSLAEAVAVNSNKQIADYTDKNKSLFFSTNGDGNSALILESTVVSDTLPANVFTVYDNNSAFPILIEASDSKTKRVAQTLPVLNDNIISETDFIEGLQAQLAEIARKVELEDKSSDWGFQARGRVDNIYAPLLSSKQASTVKTRMDNAWHRRFCLLGLMSRLIERHSNNNYNTYYIPTDIDSRIEITIFMSKIQAEFNIPMFDWFASHELAAFATSATDRGLKLTGAKTNGIYPVSETILVSSTEDWNNLLVEYNKLRIEAL